MKNNRESAWIAGLGILVTPIAVAAHPGHGQGDHGWLFGAIQPFLRSDHLLAPACVVGVGAVGSFALGRQRASRSGRGLAE